MTAIKDLLNHNFKAKQWNPSQVGGCVYLSRYLIKSQLPQRGKQFFNHYKKAHEK